MRHEKVPKFLRDKDAALRWAKKHAGNIHDYVKKMNKEQGGLGDGFYGRRAEAYSDFAHDAYRAGEIDIYRVIQVPTIEGVPQVSWPNLGKSWSRIIDGVGVYGLIPYEAIPLREVLLRGRVQVRDIDWEFGFTSFMYYGEDQWEVSLLPNSPVLVTHVDSDQLLKPILGDSGRAEESWEPV